MTPLILAFCGFYVSGSGASLANNATQVALMRDGTRTVLSMQNNYQGPPEKFAMVVPVPVVLQKENVKTLPRTLFEKLEELDAPRLVEYWEQDPCYVNQESEEQKAMPTTAAVPRGGVGGGGDKDFGVKIEAQFTVGEYEIVILSTEDSTGLDKWLKHEKYSIPDGAEPALRPYVQAGMRFFVAKVDPQKVTFDKGQATLSPLRFFYDTERFELPVRLGLLNAKGAQDLIVHILAKGKRFELANYANITMPTNIDVAEETKGQFAAFYAALFDKTLEKTPRAIVTEYSWDAASCDPCPGPALNAGDIATLGADVIAGGPGNAWGFTLTRLHARYDKVSLPEDLVFRAAPAIMGGRESYQYAALGDGSAGPVLERGAVSSSFNNFQARYAIRHPWSGPVTCAHPIRNRWGGPPANTPSPGTRSAKNLASAPRGNVQLASFVKSEELKTAGLDIAAGTPATVPTTAPSSTPATKSGCGSCNTAGSADLGLFATIAVVFFGRRRRR